MGNFYIVVIGAIIVVVMATIIAMITRVIIGTGLRNATANGSWQLSETFADVYDLEIMDKLHYIPRYIVAYVVGFILTVMFLTLYIISFYWLEDMMYDEYNYYDNREEYEPYDPHDPYNPYNRTDQDPVDEDPDSKYKD